MNYEYSNGNVVISTDTAKAARSGVPANRELRDRQNRRRHERGLERARDGTARRVDDPDELLSLASLDLESWAGGARHALVAISPKEITGRVIVHPVMSVE